MSVPFLSSPSTRPSEGNGTGCLCLYGKEQSTAVCRGSGLAVGVHFPVAASPPLHSHLRKLGAAGLIFGSVLLMCLFLEALSVYPTIVRKTSDQCWKGNSEEELWKNICQRVRPAASLQSSSAPCFGASHTGRLLQSCWDAAVVLTHLLPSPFLLSRILKR